MRHYFLMSALFLVACVVTPWFVVVPVMVVLIAYSEMYVVAVMGALILDIIHGAPIQSLANVSFIFTLLAVTLSAIAALLRRRLLE